ncbi:MAG: single-stranded DNA-binding protein [Deltaproteobacteria bacterium]|nr:single-stranded DNA-binding protein [Deltaproteobacteria bacterium]
MKSPLVPIYRRLSQRLAALSFGPPVTHVYDPLTYAGAPHRLYCERFGVLRGRVLLLGMNPGPFGMAQTGVPFGEVALVRDWIGIEAPVGKPPSEHPKRPIEGFACARSEVSGARLWGYFKDAFGTAERFFARALVANYCPLVFVEASGANRTPDKLPRAEREPLYAACDAALGEVIAALAPTRIIGVGDFAKKRAEAVVAALGLDLPVGSVLHPSPASPAANRGWAAAAHAALEAQGLVPD